MEGKKAIFLGVRMIHSNKKNQDYRTVELYTPPFKDERGFEYGGVQTYFTPLDSHLGNGIDMGAIVEPDFQVNVYSNRSELKGLTIVSGSPYSAEDFD